jgi:hypothetical protein
VDVRAGLDDVEKRKFLTLSGLELRSLARSQSLYRLHHPGSSITTKLVDKCKFCLFFFFLVAPTRGSLLSLWSIGLSFLSFLIRDSR